MGSSMSCVPQHNFRFSSKSFIRRNSSRLFRKYNPQEGQEKSNSIINILCTVTPRKEMSPKDLQTIENIKWDPPFAYDPISGWKKSSINVKNYGRMIHSSKVRFRFVHCQDIHDCYLDLFQTHLHFVSNNTTGLTYQRFTFLTCDLLHPAGVSLNPIIVYFANQEEMDMWFGLLRENIEANGGTPMSPENYTRVRLNKDNSLEGREELRNSINREPIHEWEGSQRDSLGTITYVTKVRLQHLPCLEQNDRLLVMYPSTLIILSEENDGLFYKGKLPLNMITVTTPCQDVKPNTFMIEGKMINPIVVSCLDRTEFCDWIQQFKAADVPVLSPPPPVYDIIYTPTKTEAPQFDRWSGHSQGRMESVKSSRPPSGRGSRNLQFPILDENPLTPGYSEPRCVSRLSNSCLCLNPLQSNSWSTPQTSLKYSLDIAQRHSDMCAPRQPLSPLYDEPCTPEIYSLEEARPVQYHHQEPQMLPSSFQLHDPPMGGRARRSLVLTNTQGHALDLEMDTPENQAQQRAEAVSRLKLLPVPGQMQEQVRGRNSYLEPAEPDDQEIDYDNIWEFDCDTGMIQPTTGISTDWTGLDFGARGLGAMATPQRWS
uniref:Pleckstrin homology domain containing, family N member 1 n=1 Tax=Neolamprologus brichardi TaxID=32507 RepID=A0A3Q4GZH2_NEOBR